MTSRLIPQKIYRFFAGGRKRQVVTIPGPAWALNRPHGDRGYGSSPDWFPGEPDFFPGSARARQRAANSGSSPSVPGS